METAAGPCFASPVMRPHLHCSLPIGHEGLHECFASITWGECSGIELKQEQEPVQQLQLSAVEEWCPVCGTYHEDPGEKTDAGRLTRPCPQLLPGVGANHPINAEPLRDVGDVAQRAVRENLRRIRGMDDG